MTKKTKRYISAFLAAAVLCTSAPILPDNAPEHSAGIAVSAEESSSDYQFDAATGTITGYSGAGGNITIPSIIDGVAVKAIGEKAFFKNTSVTGVVIPEGVTSVGGYAFFNCTNITALSLPDTLTSIEELALQDCTSLKEITIPGRVTNFGNQAFCGCTSLTKVTVSEGVRTLGSLAFTFCSSLTDVTLPSTLTSISDSAFAECTSLTEIVIPEGVAAIEGQAFSGCKNLSSVTLPNTLTSIGKRAFNYCTSLTNITIPENVTLIDGMAFENCSGLDSIIYPKNTEVKGYEIPQKYIDELNKQLEDPSISESEKQRLQAELDELLKMQAKPPLPETTTQIKYEVSGGEVTITEIILPEGKAPAVVPNTVGGKPVTSVAEEYRDKVSDSGHTHNLTKTDKIEATCTEDGNVEYWTCSLCGRYFSDERGTTVITDTVIPAAHTLEKTEEKAATCTENGNIEYWTCSACGEIFSDESCTNVIADMADTVIPAAHTLEHKAATEATCTENGNIEYWACSKCPKLFSDSKGETEISLADTVIKASGHNMTHTERKAPTCTENGNIEYWTCSNCHKYFSDAAGTNAIDDTVLAATGIHNYVDGVCTVCGAKDPNYSEPTETSPSETEPPVTEPTDTDPSVTEPPVTAPSDTDSSVTEPPVTDPSGTEPTATVPSVTEPTETAPTVTAPPVTEPSITMPTATDPPIIYPPYTPTAPITPAAPSAVTDTNNRADPYIQGDSGKSGWDAISDIISNTPDGGTVTVDMNNSTMLPRDIISQIKGRDIDLVLVMKNKFVWTINGTDVTNAKTVNMRVQRSVNISASTVEEYFGDTETVQLQLAHNGDFGFTAELSISLGSIYNGMTAGSYCYKAGKFTFGDSAEIADGSARLKFDHASNWLITITDTSAEDVSADAGISAKGDPVGSEESASLLFLTVIPILGAAFACIKKLRRK